ncbi:MAG: hypothetical protein C0427_05935 [Rhodobacter sp.]|nr:hypothetical protein [Rhodobacter sp.]
MPPATVLPSEDRVQDPQILLAIGRVLGWRRRIEAGKSREAERDNPLEFIGCSSPSRVHRPFEASFLTRDQLVLAHETRCAMPPRSGALHRQDRCAYVGCHGCRWTRRRSS